MRTDRQCIEELLAQLLGLVTKVFVNSEVKEVQDFIDVGEYGIALETFVGIVDEENKAIPEEVLVVVRESAAVMQMEASVFDAKLIGRVHNS